MRRALSKAAYSITPPIIWNAYLSHRAVKAPQLRTSAGGFSLSKWARRKWLRQAPVDPPSPQPGPHCAYKSGTRPDLQDYA
jgi:hypothetical protein